MTVTVTPPVFHVTLVCITEDVLDGPGSEIALSFGLCLYVLLCYVFGYILHSKSL